MGRKRASENRPNQEVHFTKALDPEITYERINNLLRKPVKNGRHI